MKLAGLSLKELESIQKKVNNEIQKRRSKAQEEGIKKIKNDSRRIWADFDRA